MPDRLHDLYERQRSLQADHFQDPATFTRDEAIEFIRWNVLALHDELSEALQEIGWKPWASSKHINRDAYIGELVDAMHFLFNLFLAVGATSADIHDAYVKKNEKNRKRQLDGYTGEKDEHGREID